MAKADLIQEARDRGLEVDESMTVKEIKALIDSVPAGDSDDGSDEDEYHEEQKTLPKKSGKGIFVVEKEFRDKDNFAKTWKNGYDVSHFSEERLNHLVETGMVLKK